MAADRLVPPLRIRVRLFAMQREAAGTRELRLEVPVGATVDDAWTAVVDTIPVLAPGRSSLRFAVNGDYADPGTALADGDEIACIPPVSGGSDDERRRILEIRERPFPGDLVESLTARLATDEDGGVVAFVGRTRVTPGTPAPGQEAEAARHADRSVEGLEYEAFEPMALGVLGGDRRRDRGALGRAAGRDRAPGGRRAPGRRRPSSWSPSRRIATPRSPPPATRSTRRRRGRRSGRPSGSRTATCGSATSRGRDRRDPTGPADSRPRRALAALADGGRRPPYLRPWSSSGIGRISTPSARGRPGSRRRGDRPPPRPPPSARSGRSCGCSASAGSIARGGRSRRRSSTAISARTRDGSAAASRSRSRWRWPSTTSGRRSSRWRSPPATSTSASRRSCSPNPTGGRSRSPTPRRSPGPPSTGWTPIARRGASSRRCSATRRAPGSARRCGRRPSSTRSTRPVPPSTPARSSSAWTSRRAASWPSGPRGSARRSSGGGRIRPRAAASTRSTRPASRSRPAPSARSPSCAGSSTRPARAAAATCGS